MSAIPRKVVPNARAVMRQIGDLIMTKVDHIPAGAVRLEVEKLPDGGVPLPEGYVIRFVREE